MDEVWHLGGQAPVQQQIAAATGSSRAATDGPSSGNVRAAGTSSPHMTPHVLGQGPPGAPQLGAALFEAQHRSSSTEFLACGKQPAWQTTRRGHLSCSWRRPTSTIPDALLPDPTREQLQPGVCHGSAAAAAHHGCSAGLAPLPVAGTDAAVTRPAGASASLPALPCTRRCRR